MSVVKYNDYPYHVKIAIFSQNLSENSFLVRVFGYFYVLRIRQHCSPGAVSLDGAAADLYTLFRQQIRKPLPGYFPPVPENGEMHSFRCCNLFSPSASVVRNLTERCVICMKPDIIDQLFSEYYNEALLYTVTLSRNRAVAEDIVSTAFFKALTLSDDTVRNFKPWLLTVCRNEFISMCRRSRHFTGEDVPEDLADSREEVLDSIIRKEEYRSLYRAIELLPEAQKEAVTLFYFSGLPIRSISEITGKSESNIKVLLCRAREKLRKILEEER